MLRPASALPFLLACLGLLANVLSCSAPTGNGASPSSATLTARMVVDLVPAAQEGSYPRDFVEFNGTVYFTALNYDDTDKRVLYYLSGTTAVRVDTAHKIESPLTLFQGALYFLSSEPSVGQELFRCTSANVIELVEEVRPGITNGAFLFSNDRLTVLDDSLFFVGIVDYAGNDHEELYAYRPDDNASDSDLVQITAYSGGSAQASRMAVLGSQLYFFVNPTSASYDTYLLAWDAVNGVAVVNLASGNNNFGQGSVPVALGSKLWFLAEGPAHGTNGLGKTSGEYDLYSVDTAGNFALEVDFSAALAGLTSQPVVIDGAAYFVLDPSDGSGAEWHRLAADGTVTSLGNLNPVAGRGVQQTISDAYPPFAAGLDGQLFFGAAEAYDAANDYDDAELFSWKGLGLPQKFAEIGRDEVLPTDFAEAWWDAAVVELYPSSPQSFTTIGSKVYFQADDRLHGPELWVVER